jgi:hypothetical protein
MASFCSSCGTEIVHNQVHCSSCGARVVEALPGSEQVLLHGRERRFLYWSVPLFEAGKSVYVDPTDPEISRANTPFNPAKIPEIGDMVPGNCVWVDVNYPGPIPPEIFGGTFESNITGDWMVGRPRSEVRQILGDPQIKVIGLVEDINLTLSLYTESYGFMNKKVRLAGIWFDEYDIAWMVEPNINRYMS